MEKYELNDVSSHFKDAAILLTEIARLMAFKYLLNVPQSEKRANDDEWLKGIGKVISWMKNYENENENNPKTIKTTAMEKYDLDFYKAFEIVMNGGAVKGDDFIDGIFLKLNTKGQLVIVDAGRLYAEETNVSIKGMLRQKFRNLTVLTMRELSF